MYKYLLMCLLSLVLFSCGAKEHYRSARANQQESYKMTEMPTIESIYGTFAENYIGIWEFDQNCGSDHGGKGSHNIKGIIEFKDNGQFEIGFITTEVSNGSITYQLKREGYWLLSNDASEVNMAVVHELNSNMEITVMNPEAALKIKFKVFLDDENDAQYTDEQKRLYNFKRKGSEQTKLERI